MDVSVNILTLFQGGSMLPAQTPLILIRGMRKSGQELPHQSHQPDTNDEIFYAPRQHIHKASVWKQL